MPKNRMVFVMPKSVEQFIGEPLAKRFPDLSMKPLLKVVDVMAVLDVSRQTVHSYIKAGRLKKSS